MSMERFLSAFFQLLVTLPASASCFLVMYPRLRHTPAKTAALCAAALLPFAVLGAWLHAASSFGTTAILLPAILPLFFLYRSAVNADLPRCLAVYVGVCAVHTFPAQLAYALDARLHPLSGAAHVSAEAALFQLSLSILAAAVTAYPACKNYVNIINQFDSPKIWYSTVVLSAVFLAFNVLAIPQSYATLHAGRMLWLFPVFELAALAVLVAVYMLFCQSASAMLAHVKLTERTRLLKMQARQYRVLQEHMRQTARLRHDFRHSVRLLSSLAREGDIESIRTHLAQYESQLSAKAPAVYCKNPALNALLSYYGEMAEQAGIATDWRIALPDDFLLCEPDMAALFGNLMENAIFGCARAPEKNRYFCLTAEVRQENCLYIVSTNSFDGNVRQSADGYCSTRHGGRGVGLSSIAAVAEKYGGSAHASHRGTEFFVDVVLKL